MPLVGATLGAFALRMALARGDLWGDEAASVTMSLRPLGTLLGTLAAAEPHPPLYPLLLKAWMRLAGTDELVVRFPSIAAGTLTVPVLGALGRLVGPAVGRVAALLGALSPFLLWYATESRMYPLAALLVAASWYALLRLLARPGWRRALPYGAAMALALLSHYFVLFVGLAQAIVALSAVVRDRRPLGPLAAGAALALAPMALWALYANRIVGSYYGAAPGSMDLLGVLGRFAVRVGPGWSLPPEQAGLLTLALSPLAFLGARHAIRRPTTAAWLLWLVVPLGAAMAVSVVRPMFQERYLVVLAPAVLLLLALGIGSMPFRPARLGLVAAVAAAMVVPLWNMAAGRYARSGYGSHAAELNALGRPGEAVVLTGTSQAALYEYYASRAGIGLPVFGVPRTPPASAPEATDDLASLAAEHDGVWLFLYAVEDYDPGRLVERWLTEHAYRGPPRWSVNGRLIRFATERGARVGALGAPRELAPGWRVEAALPSQPVPAGGLVPVRIELTPSRSVPAALKLRLRLLDDRSFIWGEADEPLGAGFGTAGDLIAGRAWTERRAVPVYGGAPAGEYRIEAALYAEAGGENGPFGAAELGRVPVEPSDRFWRGQVPGFRALEGPGAGGWSLLGWGGGERARTGERAYLTTVWRVGEAAAEQVVRTTGPQGEAVATRTTGLEGPNGSVLRLQIAPPVGARWTPGGYRVDLGLRVAGGSETSWRELSRLRVEPGAPAPPAAEPQHQLEAVFGGAARLRGYSPSTDGGLTLHWESVAPLERSYHVFVHALDGGGAIAGQSDGPPAAGRAPTDGWSVGDRVDDPRAVSARPGSYRVIVGLYDPATGARLPSSTGGDHVALGTVQLGR
ncbi:MAG TPA: glycosyltransferase family 39 protein [Chloroflexota bacterium]|nr:glycosyltransferase family 39 protein [Chloroflexota bacterium]